MDIQRLFKSISYSILLSLFDCGRLFKRNYFDHLLIIILLATIYSFLTFHISNGIFFLVIFFVVEHLPNFQMDVPKTVHSDTNMSNVIFQSLEFKPFKLEPGNGTGVNQTIFVGG